MYFASLMYNKKCAVCSIQGDIEIDNQILYKSDIEDDVKTFCENYNRKISEEMAEENMAKFIEMLKEMSHEQIIYSFEQSSIDIGLSVPDYIKSLLHQFEILIPIDSRQKENVIYE